MNILLLVAAAVVLVGVAIAFRSARFGHARKFRRRKPMSLDQMHGEWYAQIPFDVFVELWNEVCQCVGVAPELLRPLDRFGRDVGRGSVEPGELGEIFEATRRRALSMGIVVDLARIKTVDDYVHAFATNAPKLTTTE